MPSYKPRITVYTDNTTNEKLAYIAKKENRSSSNYTEYLIKKEIEQYEEKNGEIQIEEILDKKKNTVLKIAKIVSGAAVGEAAADMVTKKIKKE
ncbi:hypothetical protein PMX39_21740 [Enterocloster clostridioformis]|uniref:hypothetical protein n=1 Tax=Enterocloster clostridioformis TaxID=1531 RepID=UPI00232C2F0A|nr:hypothetical protein [Enterocloster clostridioformis]MDB2135233.1 hypothetical protein [Enterocloster clostridioformis]